MDTTSPSEIRTRDAIELPPTATAQQALHEAVGHLYDSLATTALDGEEPIADEVFDALEALYVATAEGAVSSVRIQYEYERANASDETVER